MSAATGALPSAPPRFGVRPGWYRGFGRDGLVMRTVHRLTEDPADQDGAVTAICGRLLPSAEPVENGGRADRLACATCVRVATTGRAFRRGSTAEASGATSGAASARPGAAGFLADPLVAFMARPGYDLDAVRAEHVDDGSGHCAACGGPQSGRCVFPCTIGAAAERAAELRRQRARTS